MIPILARTLVNLRPKQAIAFLSVRALGGFKNIDEPEAPIFTSVKLSHRIFNSKNKYQDGGFDFLNNWVGWDNNWNPSGQSKLWRYNLHYFDFLKDSDLDSLKARKFIDSWIEQCPQGTEDAWEPYTVSLRIVNWVKWFGILVSREEELNDQWVSSLYTQLVWLSENLEHHILANHLFENIKALVFGICFFRDSSFANSMGAKTFSLLDRELKEQFLSDGGHYELSPMYHGILLEGCLELLDVLSNNELTGSEIVISLLKDICSKGLDWYAQMCHDDGVVSLFNDSTQGIAPSLSELALYAEKLNIELMVSENRNLYHLNASGYFVFQSESSKLIFDVGQVSPSYQPGHTHCDALSFELSVGGEPVFVNAGVYEYQSGSRRNYCRSVKSHNTAQVNNHEQHELWGDFRVGRRAHVDNVEYAYGEAKRCASANLVNAFYESGKLIHRRSISESEGVWEIKDSVLGEGLHNISVKLRVSPAFELRINGNNVVVSSKERATYITVESSTHEISIEKGFYFPEFGREEVIDEIVFRELRPLPFESCITFKVEN